MLLSLLIICGGVSLGVRFDADDVSQNKTEDEKANKQVPRASLMEREAIGSDEILGDYRVRSSEWPLLPEDISVSNELKVFVNTILQAGQNDGKELDKWSWDTQGCQREWYFGLLHMTESDDSRQALIKHIVNRHGLCPLLLANKGINMPDFREDQQDTSRVQAFVQAQAQESPCSEVIQILDKLSLSALRHLHSWDHEWSVLQGEQLNLENCNRFNPSGCVLQAGFSQRASQWLLNHSFTDNQRKATSTDLQVVQNQIYSRNGIEAFEGQVSPTFFKNWLRPHHTSKNGELPHLRLPKIRFASNKWLASGWLYWEAGGTTEVTCEPISSEDAISILKDQATYTQKMSKAVLDSVYKKGDTLRKYRRWAKDNIQRYFAGEQEEFLTMCDTVRTADLVTSDKREAKRGTVQQQWSELFETGNIANFVNSNFNSEATGQTNTEYSRWLEMGFSDVAD